MPAQAGRSLLSSAWVSTVLCAATGSEPVCPCPFLLPEGQCRNLGLGPLATSSRPVLSWCFLCKEVVWHLPVLIREWNESVPFCTERVVVQRASFDVNGSPSWRRAESSRGPERMAIDCGLREVSSRLCPEVVTFWAGCFGPSYVKLRAAWASGIVTLESRRCHRDRMR